VQAEQGKGAAAHAAADNTPPYYAIFAVALSALFGTLLVAAASNNVYTSLKRMERLGS
jgi:hypothetical protein